jgi:hypothetical protein
MVLAKKKARGVGAPTGREVQAKRCVTACSTPGQIVKPRRGPEFGDRKMNASLFPFPPEAERTEQPAPTLVPVAPDPQPDDPDRFDWRPDNPELVCSHQPAIAIYTNPYGQIVIRSQSTGGGVCDSCGEDFGDSFIFIDRKNLPALIRHLQQMTGR